MKNKIKFSITVIWILLSRSYDAYCTNRLTPDLSEEANPLVTIIGIDSWFILLLILGFLTVYTLFAYYLSVFKPIRLLPFEKGYTLSNVIAYLYFGVKDNWPSIFYKLPKDINRFNHYMGHVMSKSLVFGGIVSTIMWILINYTEFYKSIHSPILIYSILISGTIIIGYLWSKSLYSQYLLETQEK